MLNHLAINSNTYRGFSLEEAVKGASEAGFTKIELAAVDHTPHVLANMSDKELLEIKALLDKYGMTCVGIGAHSNVMKEAGMENLLESMKLTTFFDCPYIITSIGEAHGDSEVIDDEQILVKNLDLVSEKCEEQGVTLALETHGNHFATGASLKKIVGLLNDWVKINYDTANVIFYGNAMPYEDLEASIDKVAFIHLKDKLGPDNEWNFPAIGDGNLDFKRIFSILKKRNFTGPISVEIEFTPAGPNNIEEVNEAVRRSFDYLKRIVD